MHYSKIPLLLKIAVAIVAGIGLGSFTPAFIVRTFNTFNGVFDQLLKFLIPLIIIGLVTAAIADIGRRAGRMLLITAAMAYVATVVSGLFSYACSVWLFPSVVESADALASTGAELTFEPFFTFKIPPVMDVTASLVLSFLLGLGIAAFDAHGLKRGFDEFKDIMTSAISKVIVPLLPLYIFGLFLDMTAVGNVGQVLQSFLVIIVIILLLTLTMLVLQYCVAGAVTHRNPFRLLATMMPAYFTALGTSSSAATIPVTLQQTLKNGVSPAVAGFAVPLCATIHLSGSTIKIVACAIAIMLMEGIPFDFPLMLGFILMLAVTMVAAPGVPGGAIMASLGVLDSILGFSAGQQALMITLYIAMDSFGTACNVTGDGAIALILDKIQRSNAEPERPAAA